MQEWVVQDVRSPKEPWARGGNLPFCSILSRQGYWKRTEEEVHKTSAHICGLPTDAMEQNLLKYKQQRATNIRVD